MGWAYHNNRTYAALEQLGLKVDLSALPGYRTLTAVAAAAQREPLRLV